jgi:phosphohistidine swiveling domain-containing protein
MSAIFQKTYTRDTTLIMQQLWGEALKQAVNEFGLIKTPHVLVDYINNGVIEVWENSEVIESIKLGLVKFCNDFPDKANDLLDNYVKELSELEKMWAAEIVYVTKNELKQFITRINSLVISDLFSTYLGEEDRLSGKIKDRCYKLRSEDHFFVNNNAVIKNSLLVIFPELSNYINVIKKDELDNPPALVECLERFKNFICTSDGYSKIETLEDYEKNVDIVFQKEKADFNNLKIKGSIANKGKVEGIVKLVFSSRDLGKVNDGDIIVSPMTTVDMMPAIKKCAGIITDEGGIICHAAIVSRELNKPCIVATKAATNILKDNDRVELNADEGVITILK